MWRAAIAVLWITTVLGCSNDPAPVERDCTLPFSCVPCDDAFDCTVPGCQMGDCAEDGFCRFGGACDSGQLFLDAGAAP